MRTLLHLWTRIFRPRHRHNDVYHPRTVTGRGVVECIDCGRTDLYTESERMCVCSVPDPSGSLNGGAEICLKCSYWLRKPGSA